MQERVTILTPTLFRVVIVVFTLASDIVSLFTASAALWVATAVRVGSEGSRYGLTITGGIDRTLTPAHTHTQAPSCQLDTGFCCYSFCCRLSTRFFFSYVVLYMCVEKSEGVHVNKFP